MNTKSVFQQILSKSIHLSNLLQELIMMVCFNVANDSPDCLIVTLGGSPYVKLLKVEHTYISIKLFMLIDRCLTT